MEILLLLSGIIWTIGWIKELATFHSNKEKYALNYPSEAVKYAVAVVLFFVWPYLYFYGKA